MVTNEADVLEFGVDVGLVLLLDLEAEHPHHCLHQQASHILHTGVEGGHQTRVEGDQVHPGGRRRMGGEEKTRGGRGRREGRREGGEDERRGRREGRREGGEDERRGRREERSQRSLYTVD